MIRDEEDLLRSIQAFVKNNINAEINILNAEKTDFNIPNIPVKDDYFVFGGQILDLPNHIFVNFAIDSPVSMSSINSDLISIPTLVVEVCLDNPKTAEGYFTAMRYLRAVQRTLLKYEASANEVDGFKVTKGIPMTVPTIQRNLLICACYVECAIS